MSIIFENDMNSENNLSLVPTADFTLQKCSVYKVKYKIKTWTNCLAVCFLFILKIETVINNVKKWFNNATNVKNSTQL